MFGNRGYLHVPQTHSQLLQACTAPCNPSELPPTYCKDLKSASQESARRFERSKVQSSKIDFESPDLILKCCHARWQHFKIQKPPINPKFWDCSNNPLKFIPFSRGRGGMVAGGFFIRSLKWRVSQHRLTPRNMFRKSSLNHNIPFTNLTIGVPFTRDDMMTLFGIHLR